MTNRLPLARVLQVVGHVEIGVHAGLEDRDPAQLAELGRVDIVVEAASDEHVPGCPPSLYS